jgi:hypothetical protein
LTFRPIVSFCGEILERKNCTKFLGVYLDDKLDWKSHLNYIVGKVSKTTGILSKVKSCLDRSSLKLIYYSLVYPYLQYCHLSWGSASASVLKPLVMLQKRVIRVLNSAKYRDHTLPLFVGSAILPLSDVYKLELGKLVYSEVGRPTFFNFVRSSNVHSHNLRSASDLRTSQPRSNLSLAFVTYTGPKLFNALPDNLKLASDIKSFKCMFKK